MFSHRPFLTALLVSLALVLLDHAPASAQESSSKARSKSEAESQFRVVNLKHADASIVVNAMKRLNPDVAVSSANLKTLLLKGPPEMVQDVIDHVISAIDVPSVVADLPTEDEAEYFPVRYFPMSEIEEMARAVSPQAIFGVDENRRMLVVRGSDAQKQAVRNLLKQIDHAAGSAQIQVFFLRGAISGEPSDAPSALPAELAPITKTLSQNGFTKLSMMAPFIIITEDGRSFKSQSILHDRSGDEVQSLELAVEGQVHLLGSDAVSLNLNARMNQVGKLAETGPGVSAWFELNTTLETKLSDYVLLAASPSSTSKGDAVALVVRITRP